MTKAKSSFIKGALILVIANMLVKLIGAAFKIPLTWLIGDDGMGLFSSAYTLYALMFTIATSGFPIAISKMVAESLARENEKEARRVFTISLFVLGILGAIGASALYFGAHNIAGLIKNTRAEIGIMAISPAVLFVAVSCAFRGYFQGRQNMLPTALSNIMEALGKLVIGYIAAFFMLRLGIEFAAAGAIYGVAFGTALSALLLFCLFLWEKRKSKFSTQGSKNSRSWLSLTKQLFIIAIPITLGACVQSITNVVDTFSIVARLQLIPGITEEIANTMFGAYVTKAVTIFGLPLAIIVALSTALVPAISASVAEGNFEAGKRATNQALRITSIFAIGCAAGVWALAMPILQTIYGINSIPPYAPILLKTISLSILFSSLVSVSSAVLQSYNKMHFPVIFMAIGGLAKLAINWIFIPKWGIYAAPIATGVCYFLIVALNLIAVAFVVKIKFDIMGSLMKPLISAVFLALVAIVSYQFISPVLGVRLSTLISITLAGLAYLITLYLVKGISKKDLALIKKA